MPVAPTPRPPVVQTQRDRFLVALKRLQDWHVDSVKAQTYDGDQTSSSKPGAKVLFSQSYPSTRYYWDAWRAAAPGERREAVIQALEWEYEAISRRRPVESYRDYWGKTRYRTVKSGQFADES